MRVLVTRAAEDAGPLVQLLKLSGFEVVLVPLLERIWCVAELQEQLAKETQVFDWIVFTSPATVEVLAAVKPQLSSLFAKVAVVGSATATKCQQLGFAVDRLPSRFTALDLAETLGDIKGKRIFYPRSQLVESNLGEILQNRGAQVIEAVAYLNRPPPHCLEALRAALPVHATTLLSSSAVERVFEAVGAEGKDKLGKIVVLGPATEQTARKLGFSVDAIAKNSTIQALVEAVQRALSQS